VSWPSLRAAVPCAECLCGRRPRPPAGAACRRLRSGDAWPAVTGHQRSPQVRQGILRLRALPQAGTSRQTNPAPPPTRRRRWPSATPASRNSDWSCAWCRSDRAGQMWCVAGAPFHPLRAWATSLSRVVRGRTDRSGHRCCPSRLRLGHGPDSAGSRQPAQVQSPLGRNKNYLPLMALYTGIDRK
jgi:hypothetical protein